MTLAFLWLIQLIADGYEAFNAALGSSIGLAVGERLVTGVWDGLTVWFSSLSGGLGL